jgi:hypothetical protein
MFMHATCNCTYTSFVCVQGWHYELEDKDAPLTYKGVVFNEMKGVYSSPDSLHGRACQQVYQHTHLHIRIPAVCANTYFEVHNVL